MGWNKAGVRDSYLYDPRGEMNSSIDFSSLQLLDWNGRNLISPSGSRRTSSRSRDWAPAAGMTAWTSGSEIGSAAANLCLRPTAYAYHRHGHK